jgi:hypothetical protein
MPLVDTLQIHITSEVYDFMFIRIEHPESGAYSLKYTIVNSEGILIRKGFCRGPVIQLRLSHLVDGPYDLLLHYADSTTPLKHSFTKYTPVMGQQTMFSF